MGGSAKLTHFISCRRWAESVALEKYTTGLSHLQLSALCGRDAGEYSTWFTSMVQYKENCSEELLYIFRSEAVSSGRVLEYREIEMSPKLLLSSRNPPGFCPAQWKKIGETYPTRTPSRNEAPWEQALA